MKQIEELDQSSIEVRADLGSHGFFASGSSRGFIVGPLNAELRTGRDDHITVGLDSEGELAQVHRTVDGRKAWWETPESIQRWLSGLATTHTEYLAHSRLFTQNTYVISLGRLFIGYRLFESILSVVTVFLRLLIFRVEVLRKGNQVIRVKLEVDERRANWLRSVLERLFADMSVILRIIPFVVLWRVLMSTARVFLVNDFERLRDDTGILLGPTHVGLVSMDSRRRIKYLSFKALMTLIQTAEERLPIGRLSEMSHQTGYGQGFRIDIKVKDSSKRSPKLPTVPTESPHLATLATRD